MPLKQPKKIVVATGGTGGHIYPATAFAEKLLMEEHSVLFMGGKLSQNPYFNKERFVFEEVSSATFSLKKPLEALFKAGSIIQGIAKSRSLLKAYAPDMVVGFGSYYSLPVITAALALKIPLVLHEQNRIPGKVNRLFSRFARWNAVTFPDTKKYLKGNCTQVAFPLRFTFSHCFKEEALSYYSLDPGVLTLLILGGSQGAKSINTLTLKTLPKIKGELPPFQIIHLVGKGEVVEEIETKWRLAGFKAVVKAFETRMDLAWSIADCTIARGGGSSLFEQISSFTPGIIIPFPFATDAHQEKNALYFTEDIGGGMLFDERKGSEAAFSLLVLKLFKELDQFSANLKIHVEKNSLQPLHNLIYG